MRCLLALVLLALSPASQASGDICQALPRLEALARNRCENFYQFADPAVRKASEGCVAFYSQVQKSAEALCGFSREVANHEANMRGRPAREREVRNLAFLRIWSNRLAYGARLDLERAYHDFKKVAGRLNEYGLGLLRAEATACGQPESQPSPAYIGLALAAGYEAAHVHSYMTAIFSSLAEAMAKQADVRDRLRDRPEGYPGAPADPRVPRPEEPDHPVMPGIKGLITEALSQVLRLHGLQGLGIDLVDKLLISQKMDVLDLVVLATKAIVIAAGGTSAGPTVGISLGIALAINGAIDYLEYSIRVFNGAFERLAYARMDEVLQYHKCQVRKNRSITSEQLASFYHNRRQDGICGAPCAQRGSFGICRPSVVFTAERCE